MSHDHHAKKEKKLARLLKTRHQQQVNAMEDQLARSRDLEKEREEEAREALTASSKRGKSAGTKVTDAEWHRKLDVIRDRNTGRTRLAQDRWNRFAGTESGGGRGL